MFYCIFASDGLVYVNKGPLPLKTVSFVELFYRFDKSIQSRKAFGTVNRLCFGQWIPGLLNPLLCRQSCEGRCQQVKIDHPIT